MQEEQQIQPSPLVEETKVTATMKFINAVQKIREKVRININEQNQIELNSNAKKANKTKKTINILIDKKIKAQQNKKYGELLEVIQQKNTLDLKDQETFSDILASKEDKKLLGNFFSWKIHKRVASLQLKGRTVLNLVTFKQNYSKSQIYILLEASFSLQIWYNIYCFLIIKDQCNLTGERGNEYYILLQGKAYCLVPYTNFIPLEQIKTQTKSKRVTAQVVEDAGDEDFLFEHYPRHQCVKIYLPGESFGEIALLTAESRRMASIICKQDSWFMTLDREGYLQIQGSYQQHLLNEKVEFLKQFEIFSNIPSNKILSFMHDMKETEYFIGQHVYQEEDQVCNIYFLMEGEIELVKELICVTPSRLSQQKYEQHFRNVKGKSFTKQVVLLVRGTYFGDEDLLTQRKKRIFSAVVKSQKARVIGVDFRMLSQFLKVFETFGVLKKTANFKKYYYKSILEQDFIHSNEENFTSISANKQKQDLGQIPSSILEFDNQSAYSGQAFNFSQQSPQNGKDPYGNFNQELQDPKELMNKIAKSEGIGKFNNVFNSFGNANMRAKNYMSLHSVYNNTCKFTIDDMPKTMTMNQTEEERRRMQFRLQKNYFTVIPPAKNTTKSPKKMDLGKRLTKSVLSLFDQESRHLPGISATNKQQESIVEGNHFQSQVNYNLISASVPKIEFSPDIPLSTKESQRSKNLWYVPSPKQKSEYVLKQIQESSSSLKLESLSNNKSCSTEFQNQLKQTSSKFQSNLIPFNSVANLSTSSLNKQFFSSVNHPQNKNKQSSSSLLQTPEQTPYQQGNLNNGHFKSSLQMTQSSNASQKNSVYQSSAQALEESKEYFVKQPLNNKKFKNTFNSALSTSIHNSNNNNDFEGYLFPSKKFASSTTHQKSLTNNGDISSPFEQFAMKNSQSIKGNEYQEKLLFKKHLSILDPRQS